MSNDLRKSFRVAESFYDQNLQLSYDFITLPFEMYNEPGLAMVLVQSNLIEEYQTLNFVETVTYKDVDYPSLLRKWARALQHS